MEEDNGYAGEAADQSPQEELIPVHDTLPEDQEGLSRHIVYPDLESLPQEPQYRMSLGDHIDELRSRLLRCCLAIGLIFIACMIFYKQLWKLSMYPLDSAASIIGKPTSELFPILFLSPWDGIAAIAGLAIKVSLLLTLPLIVTETWMFVVPGLKKNEKRAIAMIFSAGTILFITGAALAFFYAGGIGLSFLSGFNSTLEGSTTQLRFANYMEFVSMASIGFGLCFETPLVMAALTWTGLIRPEHIRKYWRHSVLGIAVLGAAFTPPDPITMFILGGCMLGLYLLGYILSVIVYRRKTERKTEEDYEISED